MNTAKLTRENSDRTLWYWEDDIYFFVARVNEGNDKPDLGIRYRAVRCESRELFGVRASRAKLAHL